MPTTVAFIRRAEPHVRHVDEGALDGPQVSVREPPIDSERPQLEHAEAVDAAREVHERVHVGVHEVPDGAEHGLATVESRVP